MSFEEKNTWVSAVVACLAYGGYLWTILARAQGVPFAQVAFVKPMLWSIGAGILGCVLGAILAAVSAPGEADRADLRDREIHRFGEYVGQFVLCVAAVGALVLCMLEARHFWIANTLYLGFTITALVTAVTKLVAYRRGFQSC